MDRKSNECGSSCAVFAQMSTEYSLQLIDDLANSSFIENRSILLLTNCSRQFANGIRWQSEFGDISVIISKQRANQVENDRYIILNNVNIL